MEAGLKPKTDAIAIEDPKGPYSNIIAIREADKDKPWVAQAGRGVSLAGSEAVHRRQIRGRGDRGLVDGGVVMRMRYPGFFVI